MKRFLVSLEIKNMNYLWLVLALLSAVSAALVAIFGKIGSLYIFPIDAEYDPAELDILCCKLALQ